MEALSPKSEEMLASEMQEIAEQIESELMRFAAQSWMERQSKTALMVWRGACSSAHNIKPTETHTHDTLRVRLYLGAGLVLICILVALSVVRLHHVRLEHEALAKKIELLEKHESWWGLSSTGQAPARGIGAPRPESDEPFLGEWAAPAILVLGTLAVLLLGPAGRHYYHRRISKQTSSTNSVSTHSLALAAPNTEQGPAANASTTPLEPNTQEPYTPPQRSPNAVRNIEKARQRRQSLASSTPPPEGSLEPAPGVEAASDPVEPQGLWQTLLSPISKLEQKYFRSPMGKQERHVVAAVDSALHRLSQPGLASPMPQGEMERLVSGLRAIGKGTEAELVQQALGPHQAQGMQAPLLGEGPYATPRGEAVLWRPRRASASALLGRVASRDQGSGAQTQLPRGLEATKTRSNRDSATSTNEIDLYRGSSVERSESEGEVRDVVLMGSVGGWDAAPSTLRLKGPKQGARHSLRRDGPSMGHATRGHDLRSEELLVLLGDASSATEGPQGVLQNDALQGSPLGGADLELWQLIVSRRRRAAEKLNNAQKVEALRTVRVGGCGVEPEQAAWVNTWLTTQQEDPVPTAAQDFVAKYVDQILFWRRHQTSSVLSPPPVALNPPPPPALTPPQPARDMHKTQEQPSTHSRDKHLLRPQPFRPSPNRHKGTSTPDSESFVPKSRYRLVSPAISRSPLCR